MIAVVNDARPSCMVANSIAAPVPRPAAVSRRNRPMNERVVVDDAQRHAGHHHRRHIQRDPGHPINPEDGATGSALAMMARTPKRAERNTRKMTANTVRKAVAKLLNWEATM